MVDGNKKFNPLELLDKGGIKYLLRGTMLITFFVAFLDGYDLVNIGFYLKTITIQFHATALEEGLISSILIGGAAIGAVLFGYLGSKLGPRKMIIIDFLLYGIGAALSALSINVFMLLGMRFIIGLGFGGDFALAPALIGDLVPRERRGRYQAIMFYGYPAGAFVAILLSFLLYLAGLPGTVAWRYVLGLAIIPTIVVIILRSRLSQSPRWLLYTGKLKEFMQETSRLSGVDEKNMEKITIKRSKTWDIFTKYGKQFAAVMMGFLALALGFPVLYVAIAVSSVGITSVTSVLGFDLLEWAIAIVGVTFVYLTVDSKSKLMGRKFNLALGIGLEGLMNLLIGLLLAPRYALLVVVLIGISLFGVYVIESQALTLQGEIFPSDIKSTAGGFTFGLNRLFYFIDSTLVSIAFAVHFFGEFLIIEAIIQFAALIVFLLIGVETKSKSLEEITHEDQAVIAD